MVMDEEAITDQRLAIKAVVASKDALDLFFVVQVKEDPLEDSGVELSYLIAGAIVARESCNDVLMRRWQTGQNDVISRENFHRKAFDCSRSSP